MNNLTCLFIGLGSAGQRHLRNLKGLLCDGAKFLAYRTTKSNIIICENGTVKTEPDIAEFYGIKTFFSLDEALAEQPGITFVCNPTSMHVSVAQRAADAGSHLFIEKPVSDKLDGLDKLCRTVEDRKLITMVGYQFRFHPLVLKLRELLKSGYIGRVLKVSSEWGEYLPDWHPWEDYRSSYAATDNLGGGCILTLIHPIDYLLWLFGDARIISASVKKSHLDTRVSDDIADIDLEFPGSIKAHIHLDYTQRSHFHNLSVTAATGKADLDFTKNTLLWSADGKDRITETVTSDFSRNSMFIDEVKHLLECIRNNKKTAIPVEEAIRSLKIALEAKRYAKDKKR